MQYEVRNLFAKQTTNSCDTVAKIDRKVWKREKATTISYSTLTRMIKVAEAYSEEMFATVSQTLNWSHLIELVAIENPANRLFYQQMCIIENWSVRTSIAIAQQNINNNRQFRRTINGLSK